MILASNLNHDSLFYIIEESDDDSLRVRALINFANDIEKEFPDSAFLTLEQAEEIAKSINSTYLLSVIYSEEGELFMGINEFARAMEHYFESKSAIESVQDYGADSLYREEYTKVLNQIGLIYFNINKFEDALEYFYNMLDFMQEYAKDPGHNVFKIQYLRAYINLGAIYIRTKKYNEAEINYTKALSLLEDDDMLSYAVILNNLGIIAKEKEEFEAAFDYHRRALKIRQDENLLRGQAQSLNNIAATYFILKEYANAKPYFEEALEISLENNLLPSASIALNYLMQIHELDRDYVKAFEYQSKFQEVNDSLMNQEKLRTITQLEMQDKFDSRVRESILRQQKMEIEQRRLNTLYISFISAALLGIIILILLFFQKSD